MKYKVNDTCIGCGLCTGTCPLIFSMGDNGQAVAADMEVPAEEEANAEAAMNGCPVGAIEQQ
jgi:ferredoxin